MKAAGIPVKKINGQGDIQLDQKALLKSNTHRETITFRRNGMSLVTGDATVSVPNETEWRYIYLVVEQGDHADNSWVVLEFDRESMLEILDEGIISMYGQPGADDGDTTNVMELRANENGSPVKRSLTISNHVPITSS